MTNPKAVSFYRDDAKNLRYGTLLDVAIGFVGKKKSPDKIELYK